MVRGHGGYERNHSAPMEGSDKGELGGDVGGKDRVLRGPCSCVIAET